jgi:hypothetical protein
MRLVRINVPKGNAHSVLEIAFSAGVREATVRVEQIHSAEGDTHAIEVVDAAVATPTARAYLGALHAAPFFDATRMSVTVRRPQAIISQQPVSKITRPLRQPANDVLEEFWQLTHVTVSFIARVAVAAGLLAHGMLHNKMLVIVAGLLFMPSLPPMLSAAFGTITARWRLVAQGAIALLVLLIIDVAAGALVALIEGGTIQFHDFPSLKSALLIAAVVGLASGFATCDDAGERQLIGLAAASQIALVPVWFGLCFVLGPLLPQLAAERALSLALNIVAVVAFAALIYALLGYRARELHGVR